MLALLRRASFSTTFYGLYFISTHILQVTIPEGLLCWYLFPCTQYVNIRRAAKQNKHLSSTIQYFYMRSCPPHMIPIRKSSRLQESRKQALFHTKHLAEISRKNLTTTLVSSLLLTTTTININYSLLKCTLPYILLDAHFVLLFWTWEIILRYQLQKDLQTFIGVKRIAFKWIKPISFLPSALQQFTLENVLFKKFIL